MDKTERIRKIRTGEPIEAFGLLFYPISMWHYEEYMACADTWKMRLSALPYPYCTMDYMNAMLAMDMDAAQNQKGTNGYFARVLKLFSLATRTDGAELLQTDRILINRNGKIPLIEQMTVIQNGKSTTVTPGQFAAIRRIIAEQNGLELPDEADNADLAEQPRLTTGDSRFKEKFNMDDMISSVAYLSHVRDVEILDWTVREFENRRRAIDRDKHYMLYASAELSGMVKFPDGNPAQSWLLDTIDTHKGTVPLSKIAQNMGIQNKKGE